MTSKQLQTELDTLLEELRSLGIEPNCATDGTRPMKSIRPIYLDRHLVIRIAAAIDSAASAMVEPKQTSASVTGASDLSDRQREILSWVALGKSNSVIASILGISPHTVDTHLRRAFERLGTTDRTVAAIRGIEAGLIPPSNLAAA